MANGKKNYFRHSFFARNDIKLLRLRDEIGVGFYFYFFSLLELCGEESSDELKEFYEFHNSTIRSLWGVNLKKSEHVASVMSAVGLLEFKKLEKSFWFNIPNLSKYLGRYTNKKESNTPNKRKEKKRKVNEKKANDNLSSKELLEVVDLWNLMAKEYGLSKIGYPASKGRPEKFSKALKIVPEIDSWKKIISMVPKESWRLGKNDRNWTATFDWLIQTTKQNYITLLEEHAAYNEIMNVEWKNEN